MSTNSPRNQTIAIALSLLACVLWSGNFFIARGVHEWIPPVTLAFWRWVVAFAVICPLGLPHVLRQWSLIRQHLPFLIGMGLLSVGLYNTLIYIAGHYTNAHNIALIACTAPIWTLFLAGLFGVERLSRFKLGGAICAFIGALVVITQGHFSALSSLQGNQGDLLLLLAAWIWAFYSVLLHYKPRELHQLAFLTIIFAVGLAALTPFYMWEATTHPTPFTLHAWGIYLYVGIAASVVAWFAFNASVQRIGPVKTSLIYFTIPVFSGALAILFLDEPLAAYHLMGFGLILTGIVISNLRKLGWAT